MRNTETILFAPLNWGLGHATRIVPLIKKELKANNKVIITANGVAESFLRNEFPALTFIKLPEYKIRYGRGGCFFITLFIQMPLFYISFWRDHMYLKRAIHKHKITRVISDNRYGFFNKKIKSVLITHQVFIKLPKGFIWLQSLLNKVTKHLISRFNECWIPDYENQKQNLSGFLSHGKNLPKNVKYIGPLSRFSEINTSNLNCEPYNIVALISGPEPQRTIFEYEIEKRFSKVKGKVILVCGKPAGNNSVNKGNITKVSHLTTDELAYYLKNAKHVIARSGYSTIMDLHILNLSAELVPTPGQSEQEYLALWYKKSHRTIAQWLHK